MYANIAAKANPAGQRAAHKAPLTEQPPEHAQRVGQPARAAHCGRVRLRDEEQRAREDHRAEGGEHDEQPAPVGEVQ